MAPSRRSHDEILESLAKNQIATIELLKLILEEKKEKREQSRRKSEENNNSINKVLSEFRKFSPASFKGSHDPSVAQEWMNLIEKIFGVMECSSEQKIALAVFKLESEVKYWWRGAKRLLESQGVEITWEVFQSTFFEKYFPESARNRKKLNSFKLGGII